MRTRYKSFKKLVLTRSRFRRNGEKPQYDIGGEVVPISAIMWSALATSVSTPPGTWPINAFAAADSPIVPPHHLTKGRTARIKVRAGRVGSGGNPITCNVQYHLACASGHDALPVRSFGLSHYDHRWGSSNLRRAWRFRVISLHLAGLAHGCDRWRSGSHAWPSVA